MAWFSLMVFLVAGIPDTVSAALENKDRDKIPDGWKQGYGSNISDPTDALSDPDQDGFSNLTEYLLNTDPLDTESHPTLADNHEMIIAYWPLATNTVETLHTNLIGQLRNGAFFSGSAVKLDGKNDYVNFGNASALSVTGSISFCLWLKPEQSCGTSRVLGKFKTAGSNREYALFAGPDDRLWVFLSDNGSASKGHSILKATARHVLKNRRWQHLAITWSATNGTDGISCYVDGGKMSLHDLVSSEINSLYSGQADLTLGAYDIFTVGWGRWQREIVQNSFKGLMSQLILCRGVLNGNEVREIEILGRQADIKGWLDMDFDQDGMPDWWERKYFGDISQPADSDFDSDGLNNIMEYRAGADPANPDTDGDGMPDGIDDDPLQPSSSREPDLLPDDWEIKWFGNLQQMDSSDFDGDDLSNLEEYLMGVDPIRRNINDLSNETGLKVFLTTD